MKYIIKDIKFNNQILSEDEKTFAQNVEILLVIEGDKFGFSQWVPLNIPDIPLSLGEEMVPFIKGECQKYVDSIYNAVE